MTGLIGLMFINVVSMLPVSVNGCKNVHIQGIFIIVLLFICALLQKLPI